MSAVNFFAIAEKLLDHRNDLRAFILCYRNKIDDIGLSLFYVVLKKYYLNFFIFKLTSFMDLKINFH